MTAQAPTPPDEAARPSRRASQRRLILALAVATPTLLAYNGDLDGPLDLYHEGERLAHVETFRRGGLPFRDAYVPHGLGEDVLKPLLACRLWHDSVASLRRLGQNSYVYRGYLPPLGVAAMMLAVVLLARSAPAVWLAAGLAALCLHETTDRHVFGFLSVCATAVYIRRGTRRWLVLAGALAGLAMLYSLEVGLYAAAAITLWSILEALPTDRRSVATALHDRLLPFAAGIALPLAPFLAWCAGNGLLGDLRENLLGQLFLRKELYPAPYPRPAWNDAAGALDNLRVNAILILLFYAIPAAYVAAMIVVLRRGGPPRRPARSRLLLAALFGAAFWITVLGRPDFWHMAFACGAFFVFVGVGVAEAPVLLPNRRVRRLAAGLLGLTLAAVVWIGRGGALGRAVGAGEVAYLPRHLRTPEEPMVESSLPRLKGLRLPPGQAAHLEGLVDYVQSHSRPDDSILDLSDQGLLYFLCERRCPTRYAYVNYCGTPALRARMLDDIRRGGRLPALVIVYPTDVWPDALGAFLSARYEPAASIPPVVVLQRKSP